MMSQHLMICGISLGDLDFLYVKNNDKRQCFLFKLVTHTLFILKVHKYVCFFSNNSGQNTGLCAEEKHFD